MFGKVFESMYDGTLADDWRALVTMQQLIVLADADGVVDMTPAAISRRTGIPRDIIDAGIEALEAPDPGSRTDAAEGRRIERLDEHRDWGWRLINHAKYRRLQSREDKKRADRERIAAKRAAEQGKEKTQEKTAVSQSVAGCRAASQGVAEVAYTDTDTDTDKDSYRARAETDSPPGIPANIDRDAWHEYVGHLHGLGKNQNPGLLQRNAALLAEYSADIQREIVDTTIRNGWTGLFKPKTTTTTTTGPAPGKLARAREALLNDPELARYVSGDDHEGAVVPAVAQLGFGPGGR